MSHLRDVRKFLIPTGLAAAIGLVACTDSATGPEGAIQFDHEITVSDFQETLAAGPTRVEVKLEFGSLTALKVEVEEPEAVNHKEKIASLIIEMQTSGDQGTLTLFLGGLEVGFDSNARFLAGEDDEITFGAFVEEVNAALAEGHEPRVELRREPPAEPQDPQVTTFTATELRLRDEVEQKIEMNIDGDNLALNSNAGPGQPDAWIDVLGMQIDLYVSEGITDLGEEDDKYSDEIEFEGHVLSVDLENRTFTLKNGKVIRIVDDTHINYGEETLNSLEAVHEALELDKDVVAWGDGVVESEEPLTILAIEVTFVLAGGEKEGETREFEGWVEHVDLDAGTATLAGGTIIKIVDATQFADGEGKLTSLAAVLEALNAGKEVISWGHGEVESVEPLVIIAAEVVFKIHEDNSDKHEFEGYVASVNLDQSSATLEDGTVLLITEETTFHDGENKFLSLEAVQEALDLDKTVLAYGNGDVETEDPLTIVVCEVAFKDVSGA